jgi:hypothetical protein
MPDDEQRIRVALELNALHAGGAFGNSLEGAHIGTPTPIFDLNDTELYERIPLTGENLAGYADVALNPAMGAVLMAVNLGLKWKEKSLLARAERALKKYLAPGSREPDSRHFVAYSYPKLAVQFCVGEEELALLELGSWRPVPPARERAPNEMPSFFERWSYLDNHPFPEKLAVKRQAFDARVREIESIPGRHLLALDRIARGQFDDLIALGGPGDKGGGKRDGDGGAGNG